jgi:hypothetical protein
MHLQQATACGQLVLRQAACAHVHPAAPPPASAAQPGACAATSATAGEGAATAGGRRCQGGCQGGREGTQGGGEAAAACCSRRPVQASTCAPRPPPWRVCRVSGAPRRGPHSYRPTLDVWWFAPRRRWPLLRLQEIAVGLSVMLHTHETGSAIISALQEGDKYAVLPPLDVPDCMEVRGGGHARLAPQAAACHVRRRARL